MIVTNARMCYFLLIVIRDTPPGARQGPLHLTSTLTAAHAARALAGALLLAVCTAPVQAQSRDSLAYHVTLRPAQSAADVEAVWSVGAAGAIPLLAPASGGPGGVSLLGITATDGAGRSLPLRRTEDGLVITVAADARVHLRYSVGFLRRVPEGSTTSGMDTERFYAVTRSLFVAPDPTAFRKTRGGYPALTVRVEAPREWRVIGGWPGRPDRYRPTDGTDLLGATLAAAPDYRTYEGAVGPATWRVGVRGRRYFADSALTATVAASLARGAAILGPVPESLVTYTADIGRKGRMSGSLQGTASIGLVWEPSEILALGRVHDLFHETLHLWFGGALESERWWVEGVTDYFAARLASEWRQEPGDLALLCFQSLRNYRSIPHRAQYTMAEETRRRLPGDNTDLLVYRKGMLAGLLLDAALRRGTAGRRSLDDLARVLLDSASHRRSRFVREAEIREAATRLGGREVAEVWDRVIAGTAPITDEEIRFALHGVTGREFASPPPLSKESKTLVTP
jgi:predicted metalloprotease with PDZ domain